MNNRIIISNPIYDEVFRYLLEDIKSATIIISTLLNQTIISLKPLSNDLVHLHNNNQAKDNNSSIELMRLDYSADILIEDKTIEQSILSLYKFIKDPQKIATELRIDVERVNKILQHRFKDKLLQI